MSDNVVSLATLESMLRLRKAGVRLMDMPQRQRDQAARIRDLRGVVELAAGDADKAFAYALTDESERALGEVKAKLEAMTVVLLALDNGADDD